MNTYYLTPLNKLKLFRENMGLSLFSNSNNDLSNFLDIPLGFVSRVEKFGGARTPGDNYGIKVYCRDVRNLR